MRSVRATVRVTALISSPISMAAVCTNNEELFRMKRGKDFECELSKSGFDGLRDMLLAGPA